MTRAERIELLMGRFLARYVTGGESKHRFDDYIVENAFRCAIQVTDFVDQKLATAQHSEEKDAKR